MPQRTPIIFWLLLAATICVDAVAVVWAISSPRLSLAEVACDALLAGQLSVICIWSALSQAKSFWTRIAPLLAVVIAAVAIGLFGQPPLAVGLPYNGLQAALLLAALWMLQGTNFWRRRRGVSTGWQYSLAHLLIATTVVAVLAVAMRNSAAFYGERFGVVWRNVALICGSVALAVVSVASWSLARHAIIRTAGVLGFAAMLGLVVMLGVEYSMGAGPFRSLFSIILGAYYLIQGVVLSAWLGWGQILPEVSKAQDEG